MNHIPKSGWQPQPVDSRDYMFAARAPKLDFSGAPGSGTIIGGSPTSVACEGILEPENQGYTGSCVGWSVGTMYAFVHKCARRSALQIYYEARRQMGIGEGNEKKYLEQDSGSYIRDAVKYVCNYGAGRDDWWPNIETRFDVDPPVKVDRDALKRDKGTYYALNGPADYRRCLQEGFPFVIGIDTFANMSSATAMKWGILGMPYGRNTGGHAITVIGFDDDFHNSEWAKKALAAGMSATAIPTRVYFVRNSWSKKWGMNGDFAIAADYLDNSDYACDGWTMRPPVKAAPAPVEPAPVEPAPVEPAPVAAPAKAAPKAKKKK